MWQFIVILIILVIIYYIYTHSKIQFFSGLWLIYGKKGSGKSTLLCKAAQVFHRQGRAVYSTEPIKNTHLISESNYYEFKYPPGSVVLVDEIGIVHDNRSFKSFSTQARDWYKLQRHAGIMVIACSQTADIDIKIRSLADRISIVRKVTNFVNITSYYDRRIAVSRHHDEKGGQMKGSEIVDDVFPAPLTRRFLFTAGWRWWKYFDSWRMPNWPKIEPWQEYVPKNKKSKKNKKKTVQ